MDSIRERQEVHGIPPRTHSRIGVAGESQSPRKNCWESNSRTFEAECTQKQQDTKPQKSDCRHSTAYQYAAVTNQKKGVLDKRDEGKSLTCQYNDDSIFKSEQRCRFPQTCCRIGKPRSQKIQHSRLGVSRGSADFPLENRDSVGFSEDSHQSANQLEQRASLPHFHADRIKIVHAESSNQKGRSPIQCSKIPTQKMPMGTPHQYGAAPHPPLRWEHRHSVEQTE